jgi:hypothetical protein
MFKSVNSYGISVKWCTGICSAVLKKKLASQNWNYLASFLGPVQMCMMHTPIHKVLNFAKN